MKTFLFIMRQAANQGVDVQETLDIVLSTAAFDQSVALLFVDDGVTQLKTGQQPDLLQVKNCEGVFKALEIYDVQQMYVEVESLQERGLKPGDLLLPVEEVYRKNIAELFHRFDRVVSG